MKFTKEVRADNCFFLPSSLYSIVRMCSEGDELDETFESSHQTFFVGGPGRLGILRWGAWMARHKIIYCLDQEYIHIFFNFFLSSLRSWKY